MTQVPAASAGNDLHVVARVGDRRLAVSVGDVVQVLPMLSTTRPPGAANDLAWITLRGQPVPVLALRAAFALPCSDDDVDHRVILIETPGGAVGLQVDEVLSVTRVLNVRPAPEDRDPSRFVRAVGVVDDQVCQVLDAGAFAHVCGRSAP